MSVKEKYGREYVKALKEGNEAASKRIEMDVRLEILEALLKIGDRLEEQTKVLGLRR